MIDPKVREDFIKTVSEVLARDVKPTIMVELLLTLSVEMAMALGNEMPPPLFFERLLTIMRVRGVDIELDLVVDKG